MKNFIEDNWFKILIILIITVGLCVYYFTYFLPQKTQIELLNYQEKCSSQAEKELISFTKNLHFKYSPSSFDQQNHYNGKLNKCFIVITDSAPNIDENLNSNTINEATSMEYFLDAYENNLLADCLFYAHGTNPNLQPSCSIASSGSATLKEYTDFINQKMEINNN